MFLLQVSFGYLLCNEPSFFYIVGNELFSVHYVQHVHIQSYELVLTHEVRSRIQCARICPLDYVCYGFKYSLIGETCQTFSRATVSSNTTTYYVL